ncbi:hypothetical protein F5050DRAFT_1894558 [Lentinula boryana]|uniref:Uncharacterized protein n=1 Tax=Lentinula boryana TaxID=40481 RepID=A0ABQ8QF19_9AGAR|nr:hypothetical protein F5050DRAFT_1894558 [Lentinula boryana]
MANRAPSSTFLAWEKGLVIVLLVKCTLGSVIFVPIMQSFRQQLKLASRARTRRSLSLPQRRFCVDEPFGWDIHPDDEDSSVSRVYVTNIDLSNHGNATPGKIKPLWIN